MDWQKVINELENSDYWTPKTNISGEYINNLECPACGHPKAFANAERPSLIICNRLNNCGERISVFALFPNLRANFEKDYGSTPEDPRRPATAYLRSRGLDHSLAGLNYEHWPRTREGCGGATMFPVGKDVDNKTVYNGRLYNPPAGEGKTHNRGSTKGQKWMHPGIDYAPAQPVYIVESITDALSIIEVGEQALAVLSAGQSPEGVDLSDFQSIYLSFDNDEGGKRGFTKWGKYLSEKKIHFENLVLPHRLGDWNAALQRLGAAELKKYLEQNQSEMKAQAKLLLATSAEEWAHTHLGTYDWLPPLFSWDGAYHLATCKEKGGEIEVSVRTVSNFTIEVGHFFFEERERARPEFRYNIKILKKGETRPRVVHMSADELSGSGLETTFLKRGKCWWGGGARERGALLKLITNSKAPEVRQLDAIGYDSVSGFYFLGAIAINTEGKVVEIGKDNLFQLGYNRNVSPFNTPSITPEEGLPAVDFYHLIRSAWGPAGLTALAWLVACWFLHAVRAKLGFFPFLGLYAEPGSGKTTLLCNLNAAQCLDDEGVPLNDVNTLKGVTRKTSQYSSLGLSFVEANDPTKDGERKKWKSLFDSLLGLYNDNSLQVRAQTTQDNKTHELELNTRFIFSGNYSPFKTRAQKERVISVEMSKADYSEATRASFTRLQNTPISQKAMFFIKVMEHRKVIEANWFEHFEAARQELADLVPDWRLRDNHALVLGFHNALCSVLGLQPELQAYIGDLLKEKYRECEEREPCAADEFFDALERLDHFGVENPPWWARVIGDVLFVNLGAALDSINKGERAFRFSEEQLYRSFKEHPAYAGKKDVVFSKEGERKTLKGWGFSLNILFRDLASSENDE